MATKGRSLAKSATWRVIAVLITLWVLSHSVEWEKAIKLTLAIQLVKTILYYIHERAWNRIGWGKYGRKGKNASQGRG